jgi:hypothetical protein
MTRPLGLGIVLATLLVPATLATGLGGCNDGSTGCCMVCMGSCACGSGCIACSTKCSLPKGCACTGMPELRASAVLASVPDALSPSPDAGD